MNHWIVAPVLVPLAAGVVLLLAGTERIAVRRAIGLAATVVQLAIAALLVRSCVDTGPQAYFLGDWPAPFGITLVLDRLAALMLALTAAVALPALAYARCGWDTHGRSFHALFQFQLMGLNGAFLTGDLFNLFVFFEVLLIASYCLLLHGQGAGRMRAGLQYVVLNLTGSAIFLVAATLLYSVTGTLSLADLALRVPQVPPDDVALLRSAGLMLLVVFALKAAVFPLHFWLPGAYPAATAPVAALFAIMTKVGVYAIVRVYSLVFGAGGGAAAQLAGAWLLPAALATIALGVLGVLAARTLGRMIAYLTVVSIGTLLAAVALATGPSLSAALFYLIHTTLAIAGLFLLAEIVAAQRSDAADEFRPAPPVAQPVLLGSLLLLGAVNVVGLPPLSGFLGKVMILQSAQALPQIAWVWSVVLASGLLTLLGMVRAGSILFWKTVPGASSGTLGGASAAVVVPALALLAASVVIPVFAAPLKAYTDAAAAQLLDGAAYVDAVLGPAAGRASSVRALPGGGGR